LFVGHSRRVGQIKTLGVVFDFRPSEVGGLETSGLHSARLNQPCTIDTSFLFPALVQQQHGKRLLMA
jgi:hypothetical protein